MLENGNQRHPLSGGDSSQLVIAIHQERATGAAPVALASDHSMVQRPRWMTAMASSIRRGLAVRPLPGLLRDAGWSDHVARRFERSWFDKVDLVLPVDHVHVDRLERLARDDADRAKIRLFRSFDPDAVAAGELGMDDPWYGTDPAYDQTYAEVTAALPGIVEHVRRELDHRPTP